MTTWPCNENNWPNNWEKKRKASLFFSFYHPHTLCKILRVPLASRIVLRVLDCWPQFNLHRIIWPITRIIIIQYLHVTYSKTAKLAAFRTTISFRWYETFPSKMLSWLVENWLNKKALKIGNKNNSRPIKRQSEYSWLCADIQTGFNTSALKLNCV